MRYSAELRQQGVNWCDGCEFYRFHRMYQDAQREDEAPIYEDVTVPDEIPPEPPPRTFTRVK